MPETLVPIRNALADAYMGDTNLALPLFGSPATFDQRVIEMLTGLGQHVDVRQPSAISTADIAECLRALNAENQVYREALMAALARSFSTFSSEVDFGTAIIAGIGTQPKYSAYKCANAFSSFVMSAHNCTIQSRIAFDFGAVGALGPIFPLAVYFAIRVPLPSVSVKFGIPFLVRALWDWDASDDAPGNFGGKKALDFLAIPSFYTDHLVIELQSWAPDGEDPLFWGDLTVSKYHAFNFSFSFNDIAP